MEPIEEEPPTEEQPLEEEDAVDESAVENSSSGVVKKEGMSPIGIALLSLAVLVSLAAIGLAWFFIDHSRYQRKQSSSRYDAVAADLGVGYECDSNTGHGSGMRAKSSPWIKVFGRTRSSASTYRDKKDGNLNYRDDSDEETNDLGNFHRSYEPTSGPTV